jgi:hypothetical protein
MNGTAGTSSVVAADPRPVVRDGRAAHGATAADPNPASAAAATEVTGGASASPPVVKPQTPQASTASKASKAQSGQHADGHASTRASDKSTSPRASTKEPSTRSTVKSNNASTSGTAHQKSDRDATAPAD